MRSLKATTATTIETRPVTRGVRSVLFLLAVGLLIWALTSGRFRDPEGFPRASILIPIAAASALIILAWAVRRGTTRFASWAGLALIGEAVTLQLIVAGPFMRFQHYPPLEELPGPSYRYALLFLTAQTLLVALCLRPRWNDLRAWLKGRFRWWQLVGLALVFILTSATVSQDVSRYLGELALATFLQGLNLATLILAVIHLPGPVAAAWKERFDALLGNPEAHRPPQLLPGMRLAYLVAAWVTALAALLSLVSYQRHPHIPDEVVYIYQARFLAKGTLAMPAPPVEEGFDIYLMQFDQERWYPSPPPGWPAILALGVLLGAPWLVNPVLAGVNILLAYLVLRQLYSTRLARLAIMLLGVSPWFVFMGMNYMTHTATLTCALLGILGVILARKSGLARWAWLAGAALGVLSLIRPLEGLIMAGLLGLWSIGVGGARLKVASLAGLVIGTALVAALVIPYNRALTGNALAFPINTYTDERFGPNSNAYGFGPDRGMGWPIDPYRGHSPLDALVNANLNTFSLNIEMFGWGTGSLLLLAVTMVSLRFQRSDSLMLGVIAAIFGAFFFYYFSGGPDFGARYWYLMIIPLVALSARGIQILETPLDSVGIGRLLVGVALLSGIALLNYIPWRAIDKYHHYLQMRPDVRVLADRLDFDDSLVLIQGDSHPDYASAAVYNPVDIYSEGTVYAWDRSPETREALLRAYADRQVWVLAGPTRTGGAYQVISGPTPARKLLTQGVAQEGK